MAAAKPVPIATVIGYPSDGSSTLSAKLQDLKDAKDQGLLTDEEFSTSRALAIANLTGSVPVVTAVGSSTTYAEAFPQTSAAEGNCDNDAAANSSTAAVMERLEPEGRRSSLIAPSGQPQRGYLYRCRFCSAELVLPGYLGMAIPDVRLCWILPTCWLGFSWGCYKCRKCGLENQESDGGDCSHVCNTCHNKEHCHYQCVPGPGFLLWAYQGTVGGAPSPSCCESLIRMPAACALPCY